MKILGWSVDFCLSMLCKWFDDCEINSTMHMLNGACGGGIRGDEKEGIVKLWNLMLLGKVRVILGILIS